MRAHREAPPDPSRHLRMLPVLALADASLVDVVRAGAARAGGGPPVLIVPAADEATLLAACAAGGEVVIAVCAGRDAVGTLNTARGLGGRGIPVLGVHGPAQLPSVDDPTIDLLTDPSLLDVNVPVPVVEDDGARRSLWDGLRAARVEERHHLVEVDGRPALEELATLGIEAPGDAWAALAAGAAGVLAGRLAAGNRRWRDQLAP